MPDAAATPPPIIATEPPTAGLYRLGRWPDPLAWPSWEFVKSVHRFDDPQRQFRVLYTADQRLTCFLETLAALRPSAEVLTALASMTGDDRTDDQPPAAVITADWRAARRIGHLVLDSGQRWLDLRSRLTREGLRWTLATTIHRLGYRDFDAAVVMLQDRRLTQAIARWAYDQDYQGIAYPSRFDPSLTCWALFEGVRFASIGSFVITKNDPDLMTVAREFGLVMTD